MLDKEPIIIQFQKVLADLLKWLKKYSMVIIGGVAVSLLGRPRYTQDIDVLMLLDNKEWEKLLKSAMSYGFTPRIRDPLEFAKQNRVLLMRHISSGLEIDISFGAMPFEEECVARAKKIKFANFRIPIPTPEDLIIMKAVAHRSKDIEDIRTIVASHAKLDIKRIKLWITEFANVLEMPEIWGDVEKIICNKK